MHSSAAWMQVALLFSFAWSIDMLMRLTKLSNSCIMATTEIFSEKAVVRMRKHLLAASIAVVFTLNCTACTDRADDQQTVIRFSWWGGDSRHRVTLAAVEQFMMANADILVECEYGAWSGWEDATATALYAGTEADVMQVNWNWLTCFDDDTVQFMDLSGMSEWLDLTQYDAESLALCTVEDALRCVPVSLTGRVLFWNQTTFAEAGLDVPKSYAELLQAGEVFRTKLGDDYYPLALGWYDRMLFLVYMLESKYGMDWTKDGKLQYTQAQIVEGMGCIQEMEAAHVIPPLKTVTGGGADSFDKDENWITGHYGGIFEWDSSAGKFQDSLAEGQTMVVGDYFADLGSYQGGFSKISLGFAISGETEHPEACAKLISYLVSQEEAVKTLGTERGVPLNQNAYQICKEAGLLGDMAALANQRMEAWVQFSIDPRFEESALRTVYEDAFMGLSYGEYSVSQAAERLYVGINTALMGE